MLTNELGRQRISDHAGQFDFSQRCWKLVGIGEGLQQGGFAHGDRAVGVRVQESALRWIEAARRNCGGRLVPCHASVDIFEAVGGRVTSQFQVTRKGRPASSVAGDSADSGGDGS